MSTHINHYQVEYDVCMKIIYASQALLPDEWASDVYVGLADDGRITFVQRADESQDQHQQPIDSRVGILLPAPANLHSHAFQRAMAGMSERRGPNPRD